MEMSVGVERGVTGRSRYSSVAIALHWAIAALVIANIVIGLLHESLLRGTMPIHKAIGICVLGLTVLRLLWRVVHRPPPLLASLQWWERGLAKAVHWAFYALLLLLPISGWIFTSASPKRHPLSMFGLFDMPYFPVPQDKAIGSVWHERHVIMAYIMIALVVLHICGALKHRFYDRDRTLDRMLPGAGPA